MITDQLSYLCPKCGEALTFDRLYVNLLIEIDIECPCCQNKFNGKALINSKVKGESEVFERVPPVKAFMATLSIKENFIDEEGTPGGIGDVYAITKDQTVVGRKANSSTADIQIPSNRYMSRQHIVITNTKGQYHMKCAQPTNLPFVNGVKIPLGGSILLKDGDRISLGQCVAVWNQKPLDENKSMLL